MTAAKFWTGSQWVTIGGAAESAVYVGPTAPDPSKGQYIWLDTDEGNTPYDRPPLVTVLPGVPYDGQEVYYRTPAPWVLWHLRYADGWVDGYGWEFLGGVALSAYVAASAVRPAPANQYGDLTGSPGPAVTVPLPGTYTVDGLALTAAIGGAAGNLYALGVSIGGAAPVFSSQMNAPVAAAYFPLTFRSSDLLFAAGDALKLMYYSQVSVTSQFSGRRLAITPVRVKAA